MIRNVIWDVDGTLFDTYPGIVRAFGDALRDLGAAAPAATISELCLVSLDHCADVLARDHAVSRQALEDRFGRRYAERAVSDSPPFAGVIDVCRHIRAIGGANVIVTHRRRASTEALLAANDMAGLFAGLVTADEGYPRKPDPTMFELALVEHRLARPETMAIGDRALDIEAGQSAGLFSCLYGPRSVAPRADLVVDDYEQLLRYLQEIDAGTNAAAISTTRDGAR